VLRAFANVLVTRLECIVICIHRTTVYRIGYFESLHDQENDWRQRSVISVVGHLRDRPSPWCKCLTGDDITKYDGQGGISVIGHFGGRTFPRSFITC
jgi:hypothetical protein